MTKISVGIMVVIAESAIDTGLGEELDSETSFLFDIIGF
jgi:hypothetical protein